MKSICSFLSQSLVCLSILNITTLSIGATTTEIKTAQSGNVRAELSYSYQKGENGFRRFSSIRLKIVRANETLLNELLPVKSEYDWPLIEYSPEHFQVHDLDKVQGPEVIVDLFTGGAHCCTYSLIYRYEPTQGRYTHIEHFWAHTGYKLRDLNQDGNLEFASADNSFAYKFASFAASGFPLQIWQYRQGEMLNVTRRYPKQVYGDAYQQWQWYMEARNKGYEVKGLLAAYLADKSLLNQEQDGWQRLRQTYRNSDRQEYFTELQNFLQENGYVQQ